MFKNVVAALNEALDITAHLEPLLEHFQVISENKNKLMTNQKHFC
jgi:hypothetical protein